MREFDWIRKAAALFGREHDGAPVGIGDDCAWLRFPGSILASIDTVVEGVHLDRRVLSPRDMGWRALATALSDLAACGADPAQPIQALISLQLPAELPDVELLELAEGLGECAQAHGCRVVGGDTVATPGPLAITVTVLGCTERPALRRGAAPGDLVVVTGSLGSAGVGLAALRAGDTGADAAACALAYRRPRALLADGWTLARQVSAMIDISDGLLQDLGHLCAAGDVGATIDLERLPIAAATVATARRLQLDALEHAAGFGDDYQLLACVHPDRLATLRRHIEPLTVIGEIIVGAGVTARRHGMVVQPRRRGYEHGGETGQAERNNS